MKKWTLSLALALCLLASCTAPTYTSTPAPTPSPATVPSPAPSPDPSPEPSSEPTDEPTDTAYRHVEIDIENYGTIKVELDPVSAPITVENFIFLAENGFYDGLTFHRIIDGFMIQGGDPKGDGTGGSETKITGEFQENGIENPISHTRGTISMARSQLLDSASSQFFIVQSDSTFLDGHYAAFGWVTEGMEYVDQICLDTPVEDSNGTVLSENQPVITAVRVMD